MSELCDIAFKFCLKAKEKGLNKHQALWIVDVQFKMVQNMEFTLDQLEELTLYLGSIKFSPYIIRSHPKASASWLFCGAKSQKSQTRRYFVIFVIMMRRDA